MNTQISRCPHCRQHIFGAANEHKCPPLWSVLVGGDDHSEGTYKIYAADAGTAAEKAVERWDSDGSDYICVGGSEVTAIVTGADRKKQTFRVIGEAVPTYRAELQPNQQKRTRTTS